MRIHELAKEIGVTSKEILGKLKELGIDVKGHMSTIEETAVVLIREELGSKPAAEAAKVSEETVATEKEAEKTEEASPEPEEQPATSEKTIEVRGAITVKELAVELDVKPNQLIAELMGMNILASLTERIDINVVRGIVENHGFTLDYEKKAAGHSQELHHKTEDEVEEEDQPEDMMPKPPVVVFLGHVDHGKTSLLDQIRNTSVTTGESGGITQHIGAYTVDVSGQTITFLDTPGHSAFEAMRARGADLTDIAVIIIAADDGIMPQTKEAIKHARNANVEMMIAINKTDLPAANVDNVKKQLQQDGMTSEDWGGEMICCEVSAKTGEGIDHLLEMILLKSEVLELQANPKRRGTGYVIEAQLEPGMGPTAHLLVTAGTLTVGDFVLSGQHCGKIRALVNDHGLKIKSAPPSTPIKCLGLSGVPEAGSEFRVYANEKTARAIAEETKEGLKNQQLGPPKETSVEALFEQIEKEEQLELKVILKADTQGSVEAIISSLEQITTDKVSLNIVQNATGNITENDVAQAADAGVLILGFHVSNEPGVKAACKRTNVEVHLHTVIYELIDDVKERMTEMLPPLIEKNVRGCARIKQMFPIGKHEVIAGCIMESGFATPKFKVWLKRDGEIIAEDSIKTLRHFQDEVSEVKAPQECGILLSSAVKIQENDELEFFEIEELKQEL